MSDLREAIAKYLWADGQTDDSVNTDRLWNGLHDRFKVGWRDDADNFINFLREQGLVELDTTEPNPIVVTLPDGTRKEYRRIKEIA